MNILCVALFLIAKCTIIMVCHIRHQDDVLSIHRKYYHYRIGAYIIRTKWGNRIKRKYICISKRKSEIVSGSVIIQNVLIYLSLPSNDTFLFRLVHEVSQNMLVFKTYVFPNIQGFLKYKCNIRIKSGLGRPDPRPKKKMKFWNVREVI